MKVNNWWLGHPATIREIRDYRRAAGYTIREDIDRIWRTKLVWWVLRCIPRGVKYYVVIEAATRGEQGHPGEVTATTMLERLTAARAGVQS